jgi:CDP-diglyceride synthetase
VALAIGPMGATVLFGLCSFMALREFITLTPTKPGDHRTLFWVFFIITPLHYWFLATQWYGMFVILIPVYAFLLVPLRTAMAGDCERFLERTAKIQWGLMVCVYCISYTPAILLLLKIPGYEGQNAKLLFWFVAVVELSDVMQYVWGKTCGKHKIAPTVSPGKTWEGLLGGGATTMGLGTALWWATPFSPLQAAGMSAIIVFMGFAGGPGDVRDQTRPRREGLGHRHRRPRRLHGPHGLTQLRRAGVFPYSALLAQCLMLESRRGWLTFSATHASSFHRCFCSFDLHRVCGGEAGLQSRHPADPQ